MKKVTLTLILRFAKLLGLFAISRRVTSRDLRILCYHGAAVRDENRFRPGLFISKETFARRMDYLERHRYRVITLDTGLDGLSGRVRSRCPTVITIDDGWYGTYGILGPILKDHGFPATLYVASYYLERRVQVFNVAVGYVLWRARHLTLDLSRVFAGLHGFFELQDMAQREEAQHILNEFAESLDGAEQRQEFFRRLCDTTGIDWRAIEKERVCGFMNADEARELVQQGVDIQLHTHRHRFGAGSFEEAKVEIEDNRRVLRSVATRPLQHFCYPSGIYNEESLSWLKRLDIVSATTTRNGFNRSRDNPYELRRFLDSDSVSMLEFEAEMSGFLELIRRCGYPV